jgi:hypothetical protein
MLGSIKFCCSYCFCVILLWTAVTNVGSSQQTCNADKYEYPPDRLTKDCHKAFCALPADSRKESGISSREFSQHVLDNRDVYTIYDRACFSTWDELRSYSKNFLSDIFGALFFKGSGGLVFNCSAFRIAEDTVVTARHCIYGGRGYRPSPIQFVFRPIAMPSSNIPVIGEAQSHLFTSKDNVSNDFSDYWYLRIPKGLSFSRNSDEFRTTTRRGTRLLIAGVSRLASILQVGDNEEKWASTFRWTQVYGSQWIPEDRLPSPPPSAEAGAKCIYHKAPSFNGMSGAPIISYDGPASTDGPPRLFVVGLHIRGGTPDLAHSNDADCGYYGEYNIGLALSPHVLERVAIGAFGGIK